MPQELSDKPRRGWTGESSVSTQDVSWHPGVIYHQFKLFIHCCANIMTRVFQLTVPDGGGQKWRQEAKGHILNIQQEADIEQDRLQVFTPQSPSLVAHLSSKAPPPKPP